MDGDASDLNDYPSVINDGPGRLGGGHSGRVRGSILGADKLVACLETSYLQRKMDERASEVGRID